MNSNDDFGQYHCVAENIHGRVETIVFVLRESSLVLRTFLQAPFESLSRRIDIDYGRATSAHEISFITHAFESSIHK